MRTNFQRLFVFCLALLVVLSTDLFSADVPFQYIVYSTDSLRIADRAGTKGSGWVGSSKMVTVGIDAAINGPVLSAGNVSLYDRCVINGTVTASGTIARSTGVIVIAHCDRWSYMECAIERLKKAN